MITINFDLATSVAKFSSPAIIKVGADVPVTVIFSEAPGDVTGLSLALGTDAAVPDVLAFTDAFTEENETTWTAVLDASDTRLAEFMEDKGTTVVKAELATTIDGLAEVTPNLDVTVQKPLVSGPASSEGGPTYLNTTELAALYLPFLIKATTGNPATPAVPQVVINTFDNTVKIYADAGWRTLATW